MIQSLFKTEIKNENDVVAVRRKARDIAQVLGLDVQGQTRVATAVSEIARNAFEYARGGMVEYRIEDSPAVNMVIVIKDKGAGIGHLKDILRGTYVSPQGMGLGLMGAKKLMDEMNIETEEGKGTTVTMRKYIPSRKKLLDSSELNSLLDRIMGTNAGDPMMELQRQNQEILIAMSDLNEKKEELQKINLELEETNRGVVALYAELDEKAEILRYANESKTSFLSDMTHEFRSPLNSIMGISQILLQEAKKEGAEEREKQVGFIVKAAKGLSDLVNDLLDIAKIEAGKISVKPAPFQVADIISTLRGLTRPIGGNENVSLTLDLGEVVHLNTDEAKVTQVLRNLLSNSLKYTESGNISLTYHVKDQNIFFVVKDTGIGIDPKNLPHIFEEFYQEDHDIQDKQKGTGLGLPLSRKLARLLGGDLTVESEKGKGSVFTARIPMTFTGSEVQTYSAPAKEPEKAAAKKIGKRKVLIVDDDESIRYQLKHILKEFDVDFREAINGKVGVEMAKVYLPDLIILDLVMPEKDGMAFIRDTMEISATRHIPILLNTSKLLDPEERLYLEQVTTGIIFKNAEDMTQMKNSVKSILGLSK